MPSPISAHAFDVLGWLPKPCLEINPGVRGRLTVSGYAVIVRKPSPYKTHKGGLTDFLEITDKGRRLLKDGI